MSKSSEEVLLIVKNVKNKKTDGTLYLMSERMAWMLESKNVFNISYLYADIKAQKISPDTKEKVQLQVILHDSSANTFLFNNPNGRNSQKADRESVKELLLQLLPKFKRKISSELEEKNRVLQNDPECFQLYKDLVVSGVVTPEEFWATRSHLLSCQPGNEKQPAGQNVGISPAFLADIKPQTDGANGLKYNLTADIIQSIFRTYPMVKKKHAEIVPHQVSESEFWTRFFQSHYFHRDRLALSSKDIFTECAKKDEEVMAEEIVKNVDDPLVDLNEIKDQGAEEEYRGIVDDNRSSNNQANQSMIRRFNQHSTMVLLAADSSRNNSGDNSSQTENGKRARKDRLTNGSGNKEPLHKKRRIKEKLEYEDLLSDEESKSVSLHLSNMEQYLQGPTPTASSSSTLTTYSGYRHDRSEANFEEAIDGVLVELEAWTSQRHQSLVGNSALGVLGELSPGGALMSGTSLQQLHQQVSVGTRKEIKQQYSALCELLRHFWACFPVSSKALEEKVTKMRVTLERFETSKLEPLRKQLSQYHQTMNLIGHLEEMLKAAYMKFDNWQARRSARK